MECTVVVVMGAAGSVDGVHCCGAGGRRGVDRSTSAVAVEVHCWCGAVVLWKVYLLFSCTVQHRRYAWCQIQYMESTVATT